MIINMLLTLLKNGFEMPMFINMLITRLGIISPTLGRRPAPAVWRITSDTVLKLITYDGSEPVTMHLVSSQTSIPVPKFRRCIFWQDSLCIFMEYVEGRDLHEVWPSLNIWSQFKLAWVLRGYVRQL